MPGAASCQSSNSALLPTRFRGDKEHDARQSAPQDAHTPLGLPRPRTGCRSSASGSESPSISRWAQSTCSNQQKASDTPSTNRSSVPAGTGTRQSRQLSIIELVNQAVRQEEELEAQVRLGLCPSPRISSRSSSRGMSPRAMPFSPTHDSFETTGNNLARQPAATGRPPIPSSPMVTAGSNPSTPHAAPPGLPGTRPSSTSAQTISYATPSLSKHVRSPATPPDSNTRAQSHQVAEDSGTSTRTAGHSSSACAELEQHQHVTGATAGPLYCHQQHTASCPLPSAATEAVLPTSGKLAAAAAVPSPAAVAPFVCTDSVSEDVLLTQESSLCSSASSSSLCSYGSNTSSTCTLPARPKSILIRGSHSSSSSNSSSTSAQKHVHWRDGETVREDGGVDLVAVLLLQDTPDIRRLRKDTWPDRSRSSQRDLTVKIPRLSSSSSVSAPAASAAAPQPAAAPVVTDGAADHHPLVATVRDWKEKLRALSAERRAQRVAALQDTWTARHAQQQQKVQQQQQRVANDHDPASNAASSEAGAGTAAAAAPLTTPVETALDADADTLKPAAMAVAVTPVIHLQAVAG